jgi:hypothetical protein
MRDETKDVQIVQKQSKSNLLIKETGQQKSTEIETLYKEVRRECRNTLTCRF